MGYWQTTRRATGGAPSFGRGGTATRFQMRQKLLAFGDDFWIQNEDGERVFRVDGKALRLRDTLDLEDAHGTKLCRIRTRGPAYPGLHGNRRSRRGRMALVQKALISPLRAGWNVELPTGEEWKVQATSIADHDRHRGGWARSRRCSREVVPRRATWPSRSPRRRPGGG